MNNETVLRQALERLKHTTLAILSGKPVRDADEALCEVDCALALPSPPAGDVDAFGYWHQGDTDEESDFFLHEHSGDVACDKCVRLYKRPAPASPALDRARVQGLITEFAEAVRRHDSGDGGDSYDAMVDARSALVESLFGAAAPAALAQSPEGPSPELLRVHQAGTILSNIAFNLSQRPNEVLAENVAASMKGAQQEWDAACAAFKAARAAMQKPAINLDVSVHQAITELLDHIETVYGNDDSNKIDGVLWNRVTKSIALAQLEHEAHARVTAKLSAPDEDSHVATPGIAP